MSHREMQIGDIVTPEYITDILFAHLTASLKQTYPEFLRGCGYATGGIVKPKPLPVHPEREGVVGYAMGRPIYDGDYFDRVMHGGNTVTIRIGAPE